MNSIKKISHGGTFGYMINKNGAQKMLDFIGKTGMTNAIDTVQHNSFDVVKAYVTLPALVFSELALPNAPADTDIQNSFDNLGDLNVRNMLTLEQSMLDTLNVDYKIIPLTDDDDENDKHAGKYGWYVDNYFIQIASKYSDRLRMLEYQDRLKKYNTNTEKYQEQE
jgi:GR25 family glycosyltransferase involved in LPS biosynthesis